MYTPVTPIVVCHCRSGGGSPRGPTRWAYGQRQPSCCALVGRGAAPVRGVCVPDLTGPPGPLPPTPPMPPAPPSLAPASAPPSGTPGPPFWIERMLTASGAVAVRPFHVAVTLPVPDRLPLAVKTPVEATMAPSS